jgi:2-iminobutanoate/2-iminopropanoate deaminase
MTKQRLGEPLEMPLSLGWRAGDLVFTSGQVPQDASGRFLGGTIEEQTRATLGRIEMILRLADCTLADVVKTTVWLADARDFARFNRTYAEFFPKDPPARSTVEARLMVDCKIEIEAVAYKPLPGAG